MHPVVEMGFVREIYRDRVRAAEAYRRTRSAKAARKRRPRPDDAIVIRHAADADARRLATLAELDGAEPPAGPTLVAEMGGDLVAAVSLDGRQAVADPFVPSGPVVDLLRLRAAQVG